MCVDKFGENVTQKKIYVVTDPECGWDNVRGIYLAENEKVVLQSIADERGITLQEVEDRYIAHLQYEMIEL